MSPKSDSLRVDYNTAFAAWAFHVCRLQAARQSASSELVLKEAEDYAAEARMAYRDTRDRLVAEI